MAEQLPVEIVEVLCSYFTGFDAFNLSLTNAWWRNYLSDDSFWKNCLRGSRTNTTSKQSWKKQYIQARSMLFKAVEGDTGACPLDSLTYFTGRAVEIWIVY
ncbi:hypothetical protein JG688_00011875 [Phytophthora aleatoria]|uniref:F-box domain-containing protein n=1 Tax=Phytophthora aleatoria TaxID=2496075 RepID=A0A8J5MEY0_9STRA|nr:hypothetical protein JG688_00011875 [Phytophthora aleatoria]